MRGLELAERGGGNDSLALGRAAALALPRPIGWSASGYRETFKFMWNQTNLLGSIVYKVARRRGMRIVATMGALLPNQRLNEKLTLRHYGDMETPMRR